MITMIALGLTLDTLTNTPILVLQEKNRTPQDFSASLPIDQESDESGFDIPTDSGKRLLPIWLGGAEAMTLSLALNDIQSIRPLPHDLVHGLLDVLQGRVLSVSLDDLRDGVFYAAIEIEQSGRVHRFDCRPSDGIALAVRRGLDIYVAESVLKKYAAAHKDANAPEEIRNPCDMMERIVLESGRAALSELTGAGPFAATQTEHSDLESSIESKSPDVPRPDVSRSDVPRYGIPRSGVLQRSQKAPQAKTASAAPSITSLQELNTDDPELIELLRRLEPATKRMM